MDYLQEKYRGQVVNELVAELGLGNRMAAPRLTKITVSMGLGRHMGTATVMEQAAEQLAVITGQKAVQCQARVSISNFRLRRGQVVGLKVTLRGRRMYEFLHRLIALAIPRVRDFRGLAPDGFDGRGNYNMGLTEQMVFPEIDPDKVETTLGMNITINTTARDDAAARLLLTKLGMPFRAPEGAPATTVTV